MSSTAGNLERIVYLARPLYKLWTHRKPSSKGPPMLGVAVSGGVDSMALAFLAKHLSDMERSQAKGLINEQQPFELVAFVVNHKIRPGSTAEAMKVMSWLTEKVGISAQILHLDDPEYRAQIAAGQKIEQIARKYRYQALGKACMSSEIDHLLVAHHRDDQLETTLMNLYHGRKEHRAMKAIAEIPDCEGIHGVRQSGGLQNPRGPPVDDDMTVNYPTPQLLKKGQPIQAWIPEDIKIETGGVKLVRPLLSFSKEQLHEICSSNHVPWVEDESNTDHTYTVRNTIRHLLKDSKLPKPLQADSLLRYVNRVADKREKSDEAALEMLRNSRTLFDPRNGSLLVQFAPIDLNQFQPGFKSLLPRQRTIAALLIRRLLSIVSSDEEIALSDVHSSVESIFPSLYTADNTVLQPLTHTQAGVYISLASKTSIPATWDPNIPTILFIRQKPHTSLHDMPVLELPTDQKEQWQFYDGRYWLRSLALSSTQSVASGPLLIRSLLPEDMDGIKDSMIVGPQHKATLQEIRDLTPFGLRHALPVITQLSPGEQRLYEAYKQRSVVDRRSGDRTEERGRWLAAHRGSIVGFPTLGLADPRIVARGLRWEMRYKKVDTPVEVYRKPAKPRLNVKGGTPWF